MCVYHVCAFFSAAWGEPTHSGSMHRVIVIKDTILCVVWNMTLCRVQLSQYHAVERCSYIIHGLLCWESIYLEVEAKMQF